MCKDFQAIQDSHLVLLPFKVSAMGPLIDAELERTDRRHAQLTRLSHELVKKIIIH